MCLGGVWRNTLGEYDFGHVLKEPTDPKISLDEIITILDMALRTAKSVQKTGSELTFHNKLLIAYEYEGKDSVAWVKIERRKRGE